MSEKFDAAMNATYESKSIPRNDACDIACRQIIFGNP